MQLASQSTIAHLCKRYKLEPSRSSGQNFLISQEVLDQIVDTAQLSKSDTVLEIGAGFGTLTAELCRHAGSVIAVELERRLHKPLHKLATLNKNLTVIGGDVFKHLEDIDSKVTDRGYKLVANVPYNITSLILRTFLEREPRPREMVLLIQKEVAERMTAQPGSMSLLSISVQLNSEPEIVQIVDKECFWPIPEVNSALCSIRNIGADKKGYIRSLGAVSRKEFYGVARIGFAAKRKQLHNNISSGLRISKKEAEESLIAAQINPSARAQDLSIDDWIRLVKGIYKKDGM